MKLLLLPFLLAVAFCQAASGATLKERSELETIFRKAGVKGTFAMLDPVEDVIFVHDAKRAQQRFVPASTFKLANSLIGLDCGAVANVDEVLPYGGKPQPFPQWEKDMALRDAFRVSNVPVYQELARRIGLERMAAGVKKLEYGNTTIGTVVDQFWLQGPLEITAIEQIAFLRKLADGKLPVSPQVMENVREISLQETTERYRLHGKTGWATHSTPNIGWYVGWIERDGRTYPFALNIDMADSSEAAKRVEVAKACLRVLGKVD